MTQIVMIGGGHAHALVLRRWGMDPLPGVHLTVINPGKDAPYTGMLPGHIAGHYPRDTLSINIARLAEYAAATFIDGRAVALDQNARQITVQGDTGQTKLSFDLASFDIGITSNMPQIAGFADHAIAAKPLGGYADKWQAFVNSQHPGQVAVIGGGIAGAELALAMGFALRSKGAQSAVHLIEQASALTGVSKQAQKHLTKAFHKWGVRCHFNQAVAAVKTDGVQLQNGSVVPSAFTVGAAGARPHEWLSDTGLPLNHGYIQVGPTLQVEGVPIFAVGDCAHLSHAPRPKAGVFAVRAAPVLFANLRAAALGNEMDQFWPQTAYLKLISLGEKRAIALRDGPVMAGRAMWQWKDWIDRRFMSQVQDFPTP